jgi:hypothetical protein
VYSGHDGAPDSITDRSGVWVLRVIIIDGIQVVEGLAFQLSGPPCDLALFQFALELRCVGAAHKEVDGVGQQLYTCPCRLDHGGDSAGDRPAQLVSGASSRNQDLVVLKVMVGGGGNGDRADTMLTLNVLYHCYP